MYCKHLALFVHFFLQERVLTHIGFGLQKDSELKPIFDHYLSKLGEAGSISRLKHEWMEGDAPQDHSGRIFVGGAMVLGLDNLFFPASLFLMGVSSAVVLVLFEKSVPRRHGIFRIP